MRCHVIQGGTIVNTIEAETLVAARAQLPAYQVEEATAGEVGDLWNNGAPTAPAPTADELDAIWQDIKAERDRRKSGGVLVGGQWYHSDDASRIQHLGLKDSARDILAAGGTTADQITIGGQPVNWKAMSGAFVPMTVQLAMDIVEAVKMLDGQAFAVAEQHRAAMLAAPDPSAYDYSAGWPAVYVPA